MFRQIASFCQLYDINPSSLYFNLRLKMVDLDLRDFRWYLWSSDLPSYPRLLHRFNRFAFASYCSSCTHSNHPFDCDHYHGDWVPQEQQKLWGCPIWRRWLKLCGGSREHLYAASWAGEDRSRWGEIAGLLDMPEGVHRPGGTEKDTELPTYVSRGMS